MNDRITEIWAMLGKHRKPAEGIERIRYAAESPAALYLGFKTPEMFPAFSLSVPRKYLKRSLSGTVYRNLRLDYTADEINKDHVFINLLLTRPELAEIFDILVGDFIARLEIVTDQQIQATMFLDHLNKWQALFDNISGEQLSEEAQRGLFGELTFLKKWIDHSADAGTCITGWLGPDKEVHDFKTGMTAVEVKTTVTTSHPKLQISNERQLDDNRLDQLFIFHAALEPRLSAGKTLPDIILEIQENIAHQPALAAAFSAKLALSGYFLHHSEHYSGRGYFIRSAGYYHVIDTFPRIVERDIMPGIGDVKYTVAVSILAPFLVNEETVFNKLLQI